MSRYFRVWRALAPPARRFFWSSVAMFTAWGIGEVLVSLYLLELGYSLSAVGAFWAVGAAGQVTGALLLGWARHRIPPHRGLFLGALVEVAGVGLLVWWPSPLGLSVGFALHYFGEAALWALSTAYLAGVIAEPHRALAFGLRWAMMPVFLAAGRAAAGFLPGWLGGGVAGLRGGLAVFWLLFVVMAALRATLAPAKAPDGVRATPGAAPAWLPSEPAPDRRPSVAWVALGQGVHTFLVALGITAVLPYMNVIYLRRFGLPLEAVGGAMGLEVLMQALAILLSPLLAERFRPVRLLTALRFAVAPLYLVMAWTGSVGWFLGAATLRGVLMMSGMPVVENFWAALVPPAGRPAVGAATTVAWGLAAIVGTPLGGWLLDRGSAAGPFLVAAGVTAAAVAWYYWLFASYDRDAGPALLPAAGAGSVGAVSPPVGAPGEAGPGAAVVRPPAGAD